MMLPVLVVKGLPETLKWSTGVETWSVFVPELLMGLDVPQVQAVRGVPFAVRTCLRGTVNGPVGYKRL